MLISCWSPKGGSGTTVVAAALAALTARQSNCWLVDTQGDLEAVFGVERAADGFRDWCECPPAIGADRLSDLGVDVAPGLTLIGAGAAHADISLATDGRVQEFADWLGDDIAIVDAGVVSQGAMPGYVEAFNDVADVSLCVIRPCHLSLLRAHQSPIRPTGLIIIEEPNRRVAAEDAMRLLDAPIVARIPWDVSIGRAVDAGVMVRAMPKVLSRALERAA